MKLQTIVIVVRHNTQLDGDFHLARREFDALMHATGQAITNRAEFVELLGEALDANFIELPADGPMVARRYVDIPFDAVERVLSRSAFAQEVFVLDRSEKTRAAFLAACPLPCHEVAGLADGLAGGALVVALSQAYIVESEAVLDRSIMSDRIAATTELLLAPYVHKRLTPKSNRLRRAKKTTLSLSHDLHIYKAKFFPRMVRALLNIFGKEGATVFDPYCGSGTALLEASLLGLNSYGSDIDPICHLISRTKVTPFVRAESLTEVLKCFEARLQTASKHKVRFSFPEELRSKIERRDRKDHTAYLNEIVDETALLAASLNGLRRDHPEEELFFTLASDAVTKKIRYRFIGVGNGKYTIEIIRQSLLERMREKVLRSQQLAGVFNEIATRLHTKLGAVTVSLGDARDRSTWPVREGVDVIVTSPPYLPASSGREHYASSRALAFSVLGYRPGEDGYFDTVMREEELTLDLARFPEADQLMTYLESDANEEADPQRDAMRFERKAVPTRHYLADMRRFFDGALQSLASDGVLLLVVAHHHIFYSHRRGELEHVVSGRDLYAELAADAGLDLVEEIAMELKKAASTRARPMAKEDYYESILVFKRSKPKVAQRIAAAGRQKAALFDGC
jgi:methylase of polypeptide subunit release factors